MPFLKKTRQVLFLSLPLVSKAAENPNHDFRLTSAIFSIPHLQEHRSLMPISIWAAEHFRNGNVGNRLAQDAPLTSLLKSCALLRMNLEHLRITLCLNER
ncbi:hypothetical protein J3E69DRAFT_340211 [Trichoderma sp. SZMC 28015]